MPQATAGPNCAIYHDRYQRTGDSWKFTEPVYEVWNHDTTPLAGSAPRAAGGTRTVAFIQESNRTQLIELARLVDEGRLRPQVGAVYPLAQAAEAFGAKAAGGIPGKIVLQP
jgi:NADPH:quinone reductase-like Zn-dependent oxidoreductase